MYVCSYGLIGEPLFSLCVIMLYTFLCVCMTFASQPTFMKSYICIYIYYTYIHTHNIRWLCFSPVKNNIQDASAKAVKHIPPECAGTAERDAMSLNTRMLRMAGCDVPEEGAFSETYAGVPLSFPPLITLLPAFATCISEVKERVKGAKVRISARSALVIGGDVTVQGTLDLDGALSIRAGPGAKVTVRNLRVSFGGFVLCFLLCTQYVCIYVCDI